MRARPYTEEVPKGMLHINGRPNIERIICLMRDELDIEEIRIVVGYLSTVIKNYFQDGSRFGVRITYIDNFELDKGLAWSILLAGRDVQNPCCIMLSDECYIDSNHRELLNFAIDDSLAACTVMRVEDERLIKRNYSVRRNGNQAIRLLEKPKVLENNLLGLGTFILNPACFSELARAFAQSTADYVEFVTFLDGLCDRKPGMLCFEIRGNYVNINDRDSLNLARYYERSKSFNEIKIGLLLYSEGVEENIAFTIQRYRENAAVSTISVVLPHDNVIEERVRSCGVKTIVCNKDVTLYGEKIRYALDQLDEEIIILAEAEYAYPQHDINKLLEYIKEADMVTGTRTTRQLIEQSSDMRGLVRLANIALAKLIEVLWWNREIRVSDVGCTFRAMWRSCYLDLRERLTSRGPELLAEMTVEIMRDRKRMIEIPVNYNNCSKAMNRKYRNRVTFFRILAMLAKKRFADR